MFLAAICDGHQSVQVARAVNTLEPNEEKLISDSERQVLQERWFVIGFQPAQRYANALCLLLQMYAGCLPTLGELLGYP